MLAEGRAEDLPYIKYISIIHLLLGHKVLPVSVLFSVRHPNAIISMTQGDYTVYIPFIQGSEFKVQSNMNRRASYG